MTDSQKLPWWASLQRFIDRPWYLAVISVLAALDLFIIVIPTDGLLVSAVLVKPRRWFVRAVVVTLGSTFGALLLTWLVQWDADWIIQTIVPQTHTEVWVKIQGLVDTYGAWALAFVAVSILPQQPAVVIAALAGMEATNIFLSVGLGRLVKYVFLGWVASHAPQYLSRLPIVRKEIKQVEAADDNAEGFPKTSDSSRWHSNPP